MPTTYTACGNAIEKNGPHEAGLSGRGHRIAFCENDRTASLLVKALEILESIHAFGADANSFRTIDLLEKFGIL
jgi:hypothetical protein